MNRVDQMLDALVGREGRYANRASDRGGETMWGVTLAVARAFGYDGAMAQMPRETALRIYRSRYWIEPGFDLVSTISEPIAEELLDTGVNMGTGVASTFLQRCLNALNQQSRLYDDLTADGRIGSVTLDALRRYLKARGAEGEAVMLRALNALQGARYIGIAEADRTQEDNLYGWIRARVGALS